MRFQLILIFMNTKVTKSYGVMAKSTKNVHIKKSDVSRQPISKTNYLKTNLLKQIKKNIFEWIAPLYLLYICKISQLSLNYKRFLFKKLKSVCKEKLKGRLSEDKRPCF